MNNIFNIVLFATVTGMTLPGQALAGGKAMSAAKSTVSKPMTRNSTKPAFKRAARPTAAKKVKPVKLPYKAIPSRELKRSARRGLMMRDLKKLKCPQLLSN